MTELQIRSFGRCRVGVVLLLEFDRAEVAEPLPPKPVVSAAPTSPSRGIRTGSVPSVLDREPNLVVGGRDLHHGQACLSNRQYLWIGGFSASR